MKELILDLMTTKELILDLMTTKELMEAADTPRNQPCFCGSGKKFKKCCSNKIDEFKKNNKMYLRKPRRRQKNGIIKIQVR